MGTKSSALRLSENLSATSQGIRVPASSSHHSVPDAKTLAVPQDAPVPTRVISADMRLGVFVLEFKDASLVGIDDMGVHISVIPLMLPAIGHMHMAVQEKLGTVFLHQRPEHLEPLMGKSRPFLSAEFPTRDSFTTSPPSGLSPPFDFSLL